MACAVAPTAQISYSCGPTRGQVHFDLLLIITYIHALCERLFIAGVMGGEQAATVLATVQRENMEASGKAWSAEQEAAFRQPILDKYAKESHAYYSSARLWDDGVIDPVDTRRVLGLSFAAALKNNSVTPSKFGVFRM